MILDLDAIEARAKAATPGPWRASAYASDDYYYSGHSVAFSQDPEKGALFDGASCINKQEDASHIAGLSPDVALALVERFRKLESALLGVEREPCGDACGPCVMVRVKARAALSEEP